MTRISFKEKYIDDGFTLIEMLVVITILGILMGIAVLGFSGANRAAIIKSCKVDYLSVQSALTSLKNDYPDEVIIGSESGPLTSDDLYSRTGITDPATSSAKGSLAYLGYMSVLGNKDKYLITISGTINSSSDVTKLIKINDVPGSPAVAADCLSPL